MTESIASSVLGSFGGSIKMAAPAKTSTSSQPSESFVGLADNEFGEPPIASHLKLGVLFSENSFGEAEDNSHAVEARNRLIEIHDWIESQAKEKGIDYNKFLKQIETESNSNNSMKNLERLDRIYAFVRLNKAKKK